MTTAGTPALVASKYLPSRKASEGFVVMVKKGTQRANANIFVSTIGTVLCSAVFSNGDNELPQSQYAESH